MGKSRGGRGSKTKKKARTFDPEVVAMKKKATSNQNLFETLWSRKKFEILGKKQKGQGRRVGLARSRAIEKRKKTLLQEYKQSGKANVFLDKRFGENDDTLGDEDKAIIRFQHERQAQIYRKSKYTLPDEEEEEILTHHGAALSVKDDFEEEISQDDEDGASELNATITGKLNFGGGSTTKTNTNSPVLEEDENRHKSKKEVMEEIIAKSKFYKAQKMKEKEEDENLMEKLDKDFTALTQSEGLLSLVKPKTMNVLKALVKRKGSKEFAAEGNSVIVGEKISGKGQVDDYDKLVKEMVLDMRAHATDRTKTPQEIAQEDRAHLESLEEERKKRMVGTEDSDDEESDENESSKRRLQKRIKLPSGDDLGDSFVSDDEPDKKGWVDDVLGNREEDSQESQSDDDVSASEESEGSEADSEMGEGFLGQCWEQSDEDNDVDRHEDMLAEAGERASKKKIEDNMQLKIRKRPGEINVVEQKPLYVDKNEPLPFVINAPTNLTELKSLLDNRSDDEMVEAIHRIRACNAISLAAENRRKMQVFYGVLLQYFAVLADEKPLCLNKLNLLVRPLMEMSLETPYFAAVCARQRIVHTRNQMYQDLKSPGKNSSWPSLKTLFLLRLWSLIFPCSDFRHVVMTPAILLMSEYVMRCPVNSGRDIAVGAFLCSMLLSVTRQGRRFCPEAINFLQALLMTAVSVKISLNETVKFKDRCPIFLRERMGSRPWLRLSSSVVDLPEPLNFVMIMEATDDSPLFDSDTFRVGILLSVTETLRGFVDIYLDIVSFPEVFLPFLSLLHTLAKEESIPKILQLKMTEVACLIKEKIDEVEMLRQPLRMRMQKPTPIKQFNPKFEENFVHGRDYDPDRERAERKKLQRRIKQEAKGAARELRKDNYFLHEVKSTERALVEEERAEKYREAMSFLQQQESAFKSGQLGKGRKRRK